MHKITIAFHNLYEELNCENRLFEMHDAAIGDDLLLPFSELRQRAEMRGIVVATLPVLLPSLIDAYVFIDMPDPACSAFRLAVASGRPVYLLMLESRLIRPQNYDSANLNFFHKIFTYDDSLVDGKKFIKLNYSFKLPERIPKELGQKKKLCVTIAGNKVSRHSQELYSERVTAIRWFERHHPEDFDLFGIGWDKVLSSKIPQLSLLNRVNWLKRFLVTPFPSWRGSVTRKRDVMGAYRFALCYENIRDVPGYITEKIFDAFFAGTVPVYRGADNIADHIPKDCFIDLRSFPDYSDLYDHLIGISDERYLRYLKDIEIFLAGDRARPFSCDFFSDTLLTEILRDK